MMCTKIEARGWHRRPLTWLNLKSVPIEHVAGDLISQFDAGFSFDRWRTIRRSYGESVKDESNISDAARKIQNTTDVILRRTRHKRDPRSPGSV